jgi:hypothetical protein
MGVSIIEQTKSIQFMIMDVIVFGGLEWLNKVPSICGCLLAFVNNCICSHT